MKIIADTNVLARAILDDDEFQSERARAALESAETIAVSSPVLCELVWVLSRGYRIANAEIAAVIRRLAGSSNVELDRVVVEAGLAFLDAGGDFADGVIAAEGRRLGGETFLSFDKLAVKLAVDTGFEAKSP